MFRFTARLFAALLAVTLVFSASPLPHVWADDGQPPPPNVPPVSQSSSITFINPSGEWAILTSRFEAQPNCWLFGCSWNVQGSATVEVSAGLWADAWTILSGPNIYEDTHNTTRCYAGFSSPVCTSAMQWHSGGAGAYYNEAQSGVRWSQHLSIFGTHRVSVTLP